MSIVINTPLDPTSEEMLAAREKAAELETQTFKNAYIQEYAEHLHNSSNYCKERDTIRRLRCEVRRLRSLLKTKDRMLSVQKSFYEAMLDDVQKREGTSKETVEQWFEKMLQNAVKGLGL